jgi:hypothetical protein
LAIILEPTVTGAVAFDVQPVALLVKVKVTEPLLTPVTTPELFTVAIELLLLAHVPPVEGNKVVVLPTHMEEEPEIPTAGIAFMVIVAVGFEAHPVEVFVKVNVADPAADPVTRPALVTDATPELLLTQVPPDVGDKVVVEPTHIELAPVILTVGFAITVTAFVGFDTQPVAVLVKVNVADPAVRAVTSPALVTLATAALLLTHVPPVVGDNVVVEPSHMDDKPVIPTTGLPIMVMALVAFELHPVVALVNVNVTLPAATPVTTPVLVTVAIALSLLAQVPPVEGDNVVVIPTQIEVGPVILTIGFAFTVTSGVALETQLVLVLA